MEEPSTMVTEVRIATVRPLSSTRKMMSNLLVQSVQTVPHYRVSIEVNLAAQLTSRAAIAATGVKPPSVTAFLVRACALALQSHPRLNAHFLAECIHEFPISGIAVAVDAHDAVYTPVLKGAHERSVEQIGSELNSLVERVRKRRFTREDFAGATFTLSNLGMFDVVSFDAIITPPQVAALAAGGVFKRTSIINGRVTEADICILTLSCDHRAVDGAAAAKFLRDLRDILQASEESR